MYRRAINVRPGRISRIIARERDQPSAGLDRNPLHHERIVGAQHIDAITQARSLIRGVDQDLVAVTQRGLHRLSMNMDDRQARALGPGQLAQPAFVKAKAGMGCLTLRDRTKTGRGRSEEHTSELQSLMRNSYAVF